MNSVTQRFCLIGLATALALAAPAGAAIVDIGAWQRDLGSGPLSNNTGETLTVGNGSSNSANAVAVQASISPVALSQVGDWVAFSGTAQLMGIDVTYNSADQFRFGLYDTAAKTGITGWLGYFAGNSTDAYAGHLYERANPNTGSYYSTTGATSIATSGLTVGPLVNGTYDFDLTLTRTASGLSYVASLVRASDSAMFLSVSGTDTSPQTYTFDRVGLLSGGYLYVDQIVLTDMSVRTPEPATLALLGLGGLGVMLRRRRA